MVKKTLTSLALVAGCAIALAVPAQAQTLDTQITMYERFLETNLGVRQERARRECGPITIAHLRMGCLDSFGLTEDDLSRNRIDGLTGGGDGRMNPIDRTFQGPEMYDPRFGR